jgi:hypothetical protein
MINSTSPNEAHYSYLVTFLLQTANIDNKQPQEAQPTTTTTPISNDINTIGQTIKVSVVFSCHLLSTTISNRMGRDGEIVGLGSGESDRACESHDICGNHVSVGDLVKFKVVVLEDGGWRPRSRSRQSRLEMELRAVTLAS